jgi:nitrogen fixation/metabolism regulation signal transduction histidine kinase
VRSSDEIGELARDFNAMADSLERYRSSSLGELLQAQRASQAAIDSLPDPVIMFGLYEVLNVNEAATRLLGIGAEAGARDALEKCDPAVRAALERVRAHVLSGRGPFQPTSFAEAVRCPAPGGERHLLPRGAPIYGEEGEVAGAAVLLQDVTRLQRADELKSDLVAFVAHEFRTPLTSLQMATGCSAPTSSRATSSRSWRTNSARH